jgi:hypothetical protein
MWRVTEHAVNPALPSARPTRPGRTLPFLLRELREGGVQEGHVRKKRPGVQASCLVLVSPSTTRFNQVYNN